LNIKACGIRQQQDRHLLAGKSDSDS